MRAGHELQLAEDVFKLQHLLECNILQHREEIEEITNAAVKEQQIEIKLNGIKSEWEALNLVSTWPSHEHHSAFAGVWHQRITMRRGKAGSEWMVMMVVCLACVACRCLLTTRRAGL